MTTGPSIDDHTGQDKIWNHFQNAVPESFLAARPRLQFILSQIAKKTHALNRPRVLNIGIGEGWFEEQADRRGWEIHALDPDEPSCQRLAARGIPAHAAVAEHMPLASDSFDVAVACEVLEHLGDTARRDALRQIARVLKPGAWFLGTVPYAENLAASQVICPKCGDVFHRWGHQASFDLPTLAAELTDGFQMVELRRTAFVAFRSRSTVGKIKSFCRLVLARRGAAIAIPSIYWSARKKSPGSG